MRIRNVKRAAATGIVATMALFAPHDASATLLFTAQAGQNAAVDSIPPSTCNPSNNVNVSSSSPVAAEITCGNGNGTEHALAGASYGHVGGSALAASVTDGTRMRLGTTSIFRDDNFIFTSNNPQIVGSTSVSLNLVAAGDISTTLGAGATVTFEVIINGATVVGFYQRSENAGGLVSCQSTFVGGVSGPLCDGALPGGANHLQTVDFGVPLNSPVMVSLFLELDIGAADAGHTAGADFGHSFDFPIGAALFNLADGVTVNEPDTFVFNNLFAPPSAAAIPEPGSLSLLVAGLAALGARRMRQKTSGARA